MIESYVYTDNAQNSLSAAGYYRNPNNLDSYKEGSTFLAKLNNEKDNSDFEQ